MHGPTGRRPYGRILYLKDAIISENEPDQTDSRTEQNGTFFM